MSTEKNWWYTKSGERLGPHTSDELKVLAANGRLAPTDMVWKEGLTDWLQASSIKGLFAGDGSSVPPPLQTGAQANTPPATPKANRKMHVVTKVAVWIAGIFVVLIVLTLIFGPNEQGSSTASQGTTANSGATQAASSPASEPPPVLKVGDSFSTPTFEIRIISAQVRSSVGDSMFNSQAGQGGIYVAIKWSYKNISKKPISAFDLPTLHLVSPDGTKYDTDLGASASYATELNTNAKVLSDLNPGIQVTDADVFEVSREQFNPELWKILVDADQEAEVKFAADTK